MRTWLFWDQWHIEHQDNVVLAQGQPEWRPEATYEDPTFDNLAFWPRVFQDLDSGQWRMLYFGSGFPLTLLGAESEDGIHWRPMDRPEVRPRGEKFAPNHLCTVPSANGGPVYLDTHSQDGWPFKFYCIQRGGPAAERARLDTTSYFHELVTGEGVKKYLAEQLVVRSRDGLRWEIDPSARWGQMPWHPDPPTTCYYVPSLARHVMLTRPGWGDRRVALQTSADALRWEGLHVIMQPDPMDPAQTQLYGMPVFPYEGAYVGLLWLFHSASSAPLERFNQVWGTIDSQLAYSADGLRWQRGLRQPFIPVNEPGLPGSGMVYPTSLVDTGAELRIYSGAMPELHHQLASQQFVRKGESSASAVLLHTLRKDGFMYLASAGHWAEFTTKPLRLAEPALRLNVAAPYGDLVAQLTDLYSRPLPGFAFDDCTGLHHGDSLDWPLRWKEHDLREVVGQVVRLEVRFRNARLFAVRGDFHFLDALDVALTEDGKPIDRDFLDW